MPHPRCHLLFCCQRGRDFGERLPGQEPPHPPTLVWEFPQDFYRTLFCYKTPHIPETHTTCLRVALSAWELRPRFYLQSSPQLLHLTLPHPPWLPRPVHPVICHILAKAENKRLQNSSRQKTAFGCFPRPLPYGETPFSGHQKRISISRVLGGELVPSRFSP